MGEEGRDTSNDLFHQRAPEEFDVESYIAELEPNKTVEALRPPAIKDGRGNTPSRKTLSNVQLHLSEAQLEQIRRNRAAAIERRKVSTCKTLGEQEFVDEGSFSVDRVRFEEQLRKHLKSIKAKS